MYFLGICRILFILGKVCIMSNGTIFSHMEWYKAEGMGRVVGVKEMFYPGVVVKEMLYLCVGFYLAQEIILQSSEKDKDLLITLSTFCNYTLIILVLYFPCSQLNRKRKSSAPDGVSPTEDQVVPQPKILTATIKPRDQTSKPAVVN